MPTLKVMLFLYQSVKNAKCVALFKERGKTNPVRQIIARLADA